MSRRSAGESFARLRDALDATLEELIRDGKLADLTRARFGTDTVVEVP